ncbi:CAAX prenyl protease 1 like protein [Astathelohania contejeani]|uniref:CAAX prenyl protease n=1 Tax=Astathelohania contejeani TaxID=164912 RepID=A0ABQ7I053_9MICR|nr:CAAX prenyl protease 1 like protein [Thelohania contejeani]
MIDSLICRGIVIITIAEIALSLKQIFKLIRSSQTKSTARLVNDEEFKHMRAYNIDKLFFNIFSNFLSALKIILIIKLNLIGETYSWIQNYLPNGSSHLHQILLYLIYINVSRIINLPLDIYSIFVIESRHGFNKTSAFVFWSDFFKMTLILNLILAPLLKGTLVIIHYFPKVFFWQLWCFFSIFQIMLIVLYPSVIQPLFNKFTPLPEGDLKTRIQTMAKRINFNASAILTMDGSKRSGHSNAYFIGLFKEKRIVLFDTLITQLENEEIEAVMAHEFGHWYHSHTWMLVTQSLSIQLIYFYMFNRFLGDGKTVMVSLMEFMFMLSIIDLPLTLFTNIISRFFEKQADMFAVDMELGNQLSSGLIKITKENKGNLCPDKWYSTLYHSHPTLMERLENIEMLMRKKQ